jgi:hypothetical protein
MVVRRCRSRQRHQGTTDPGDPGGGRGAGRPDPGAARLPPAQREAVLLNCVANLPVTRVAEVMGVKAGRRASTGLGPAVAGGRGA